MSNDLLTGVLEVQTIVKFRRNGDAKMTCRHLRHTRTNGLHHDRLDEQTSLQTINIARRASLWRMSIVVSPAYARQVIVANTMPKPYFDLV